MSICTHKGTFPTASWNLILHSDHFIDMGANHGKLKYWIPLKPEIKTVFNFEILTNGRSFKWSIYPWWVALNAYYLIVTIIFILLLKRLGINLEQIKATQPN